MSTAGVFALTTLVLLLIPSRSASSDEGKLDQNVNVIELPPSVGHCSVPALCITNTSGTGHVTYEDLTDGVITLERCFSYCFNEIDVTSFPDLDTNGASNRGRSCLNESLAKAYICYAACVFTESAHVVKDIANLGDMNLTCNDLCTVPNGICERAVPNTAEENCTETCKSTVCSEVCNDLKNNFPDLVEDQKPSPPMSLPHPCLNYPNDYSLREQGALEFTAENFHFANSSVGIIWKVFDGTNTSYIPQSLPLILLKDEVGHLYRTGINLLAIRKFQCQPNITLSYAIVNQYGISQFSETKEQCFLGSWFPTPPTNVSIVTEFLLDENAHLQVSIVDNDRNQDVSSDSVRPLYHINIKPLAGKCQEGNRNKNKIYSNDTKLPLVVQDSEVWKLLNIPASNNAVFNSCSYEIEISTLPPQPLDQQLLATKLNVTFQYPNVPELELTIGNIQVHNPTTGLVNLSCVINVTSSPYSLVPYEDFHATVRDDPRTLLPVHCIFQNIKKNQTVYDGYYPDELTRSDSQNHSIQITFSRRFNDYSVRTLFLSNTFLITRVHPSPVRNISLSDLELTSNFFRANISWIGPKKPQGAVKEYKITLNSPQFVNIFETVVKIDDSRSTDTELPVKAFIEVEIAMDVYYNISIVVVSEFNLESDPETLVVDSILTIPPSLQTDVPAYIIAVVVVLLVILILIVAGVFAVLYWYHRKNKRVAINDDSMFVGGVFMSQVNNDYQENVEVALLGGDEWELSPENIILDGFLGEGEFGTVYKSRLMGNISTPLLESCEGSVVAAVKLLRENAPLNLREELLKEINTMKRVTMGRCPHVVNMIGCSTFQEPIALVLEYVPHGDLLSYLKAKRRKGHYTNMSQFEQGALGIDNAYPEPVPDYVNPTSTSDQPLSPVGQTSISDAKPSSPTQNMRKQEGLSDELTAEDLLLFAHQIAIGMEFLSSLGIVHRDLACRNVLIGDKNLVKVSDFGLARENDIYIKTTDGKLPLRWMAIESIVDRVYTTKSDVWSFGVTLWEIVTLGCHPYPDIGNKALLQRLTRGYRMDKPNNCSDELYNIMMDCWANKPEDRPNFTELSVLIESLESKQNIERYVDMDIDEMLPYYDMKPDDTEVTDEDLGKVKSGEYFDKLNTKEDIKEPTINPDSYDKLTTKVQKVNGNGGSSPYFNSLKPAPNSPNGQTQYFNKLDETKSPVSNLAAPTPYLEPKPSTSSSTGGIASTDINGLLSERQHQIANEKLIESQ